MREVKSFNLSEFERKTGFVPSGFHYKVTDEEFLFMVRKIIEDALGDCNYDFKLSSGTDNSLQILNTGDLLHRIYGNPTRIQAMHSSFYILKFIFSKIIGEDVFVECTTSYRSQNNLYVNIIVESNWVHFKKNLENDTIKRNFYSKITEQISVLENKKIELLENNIE